MVPSSSQYLLATMFSSFDGFVPKEQRSPKEMLMPEGMRFCRAGSQLLRIVSSNHSEMYGHCAYTRKHKDVHLII